MLRPAQPSTGSYRNCRHSLRSTKTCNLCFFRCIVCYFHWKARGSVAPNNRTFVTVNNRGIGCVYLVRRITLRKPRPHDTRGNLCCDIVLVPACRLCINNSCNKYDACLVRVALILGTLSRKQFQKSSHSSFNYASRCPKTGTSTEAFGNGDIACVHCLHHTNANFFAVRPRMAVAKMAYSCCLG